MTSFVDYYNKHGIIPVNQKIDERHFRRRKHLYKELGCPPSCFLNNRILEIGAGTADNSVVTSSFGPQSYTFWDGSAEAVKVIRQKIQDGVLNNASVELVNVFSEEFSRDSRFFDIVICEGASAQDDPKEFYRRVLSKVNTNHGIGIVTTSTNLSSLSELLRKVWYIPLADLEFEDASEIGAEVFKSHLASLEGVSRSAIDWVNDSILQPSPAQFSIDISEILQIANSKFGGKLEFLGSSSPRFFNDFTWYKQCSNNGEEFNTNVSKEWDKSKICLVDSRLTKFDVANIIYEHPQLANTLEEIARIIAIKIASISNPNETDAAIALISECTLEIETILSKIDSLQPTYQSIKDFNKILPMVCDGNINAPAGNFKQWWGRGQQYLSLSF